MRFLIPYLFAPARLIEAATRNLRLPALETLLARGTMQSVPAEGTEAALCKSLGIARQQDWPLAPIMLEAEGETAGDAFWLRADPVHLRLMRDRIVLADNSELNLSLQEAEALSASIAQHFGENMQPTPQHPKRWYLRFPQPPCITTTPPTLAIGRNINPLLPQGADSRQFRGLLNELQMLLFSHPVNQARESRGDLPVNSLWLWGGGIKPVASNATERIYSNDPETCAMARICGAQVNPVPSKLESPLLVRKSTILLEGLMQPGQCGDSFGWRTAICSMEADWFSPLLASLNQVGPHGLQLLDPVFGKVLFLNRTDAWKIWRRPKTLLSVASRVNSV